MTLITKEQFVQVIQRKFSVHFTYMNFTKPIYILILKKFKIIPFYCSNSPYFTLEIIWTDLKLRNRFVHPLTSIMSSFSSRRAWRYRGNWFFLLANIKNTRVVFKQLTFSWNNNEKDFAKELSDFKIIEFTCWKHFTRGICKFNSFPHMNKWKVQNIINV